MLDKLTTLQRILNKAPQARSEDGGYDCAYCYGPINHYFTQTTEHHESDCDYQTMKRLVNKMIKEVKDKTHD